MKEENNQPIPTPRTDAKEYTPFNSWPCVPVEFSRQLETELTAALASLAAAQAACAVKDEALRDTRMLLDKALSKMEPGWYGISRDGDAAMASAERALSLDCAAPVIARMEKMRVALEELANFDDKEIAEIARKALEDEPK